MVVRIFNRNRGRPAQGRTWAGLVLLVLVVLIPALTVGWLVMQASGNKRLAMEKIYDDARTGYLETGRNTLKDEVVSIAERCTRMVAEVAPERRWITVFASGRGDGFAPAVIGAGNAGKEAESLEPVALDLRILEDLEAIRGLRNSGAAAEAEQRIEDLLRDPDLMEARTADGRLVAPMVAYLATETASDADQQAAARLRFRSMVMEEAMQTAMPVSQYLYYLGRIRTWAEDPDVDRAYRFTRNGVAWTEGRVATEETSFLPVTRRGNLIGFQSSPGSGVVILEPETLAARVQHRLDLLEERAGGHLVLRTVSDATASDSSRDKAEMEALRVEAGFPLDDWFIEFLGDDGINFMGRAEREVLWLSIVGALVIAISISLSLALFKVMQRQAKLAQLKNDLVATVSHELKTPVASIRLLVDTLQSDRTMDPVRVRDYLGLITRENNRLGHLIENFLSFSRMERNKDSFDLKPVGPAGIAREAEKTFHERRADWNGNLTLDIEDGLPPIQADHDALQTAIGNLLENARKYGGDEPDITLAARRTDHVIEFSVTDLGIGISREDQRQIFEKFYQARTRLSAHSGGVGLGLSIVSFIVEKHRGELVLESSPGRGSVFTIRIPLAGSAMSA